MIELNARKPRDEKRQIAYFTINGYEFIDGGIPVELKTDTKVLAWLEKNKDQYMFLILQRIYRNGGIWADWPRFQKEDMTRLEAMRKWIAKGCKNEDGTIVEKQPWISSHPKGIKLKAEIAKTKTTPAIKKVLDKMADNF